MNSQVRNWEPVQTTLSPNVATSLFWTNPSNALVDDGNYSILPGGLYALPNTWLRLYDFGFSLTPYPIEIVGIKVEIRAEDGAGNTVTPGEFERFEIALSVNGGVSTVGSSIFIPYYQGAGVAVVAGNAMEQWGRVWTKAEIESANFTVMIRRGDVLGSEERFTDRRIDAVSVTIFYNLEGSSFVMAERLIGNQRYIVRRDVPSGSNTNQWWNPTRSRIDLESKPEYLDNSSIGSFVGDGHVMVYESSDGSLVLPDTVDANELGLWLSARFGLPATTTVVAGAYSHEWIIDPMVRPQPVLLECQQGAIDDGISEQFRQVCLRQMGFNATKRSFELSGSAFGQAVGEKANKIEGGVSEVQTIATSGTPTGGTITVKYKGASATWAYNASSASVQTALQALSTVGAGNMTVTGGAGSPWVITGAGAFTGIELNLIEKVSHNLTGGTLPDFTVVRTTPGGWKTFVKAPLIGGRVAAYEAATIVDLAAGKLNDLHSFAFDSGDGFDPQDKMDPDLATTYSVVVPKPYQVMVSMVVQADAFGQTLAGRARTQENRYLRAKQISDQMVTGSTPYSLEIELYGQFKDGGTRSAAGQIVGRNFMFNAKKDPATGRAGVIRLVNGVASYAV